MREKNKPTEAEAIVTLSIITGDEPPFASATLTRRSPSAVENGAADWLRSFWRDGVFVYVVGRGRQVNDRRLRRMADAMIEASNLASGVDGVVACKAQRCEPEAVEVGDFVDFENDPFWKRIKAISAGAAL